MHGELEGAREGNRPVILLACLLLWGCFPTVLRAGEPITLDPPGGRGVELAFLPGGKELLSDGKQNHNPAVFAWNLETHECETVVEVIPRGSYHFALSADGKTLATLHRFERERIAFVRTWKVPGYRMKKQFLVAWEPWERVFLDADGKTVVVVNSNDSVIHLHDAGTGRVLARLGVKRVIGRVNSASLSRDGRLLACGHADGSITLWDVAERKLLHDIWVTTRARPSAPPRSAPIRAVAVSADGKTVAATFGDLILFYDAKTGKVADEVRLGRDVFIKTTAMAFSPDGKWLALGGRPRTLLLWDRREGKWRNRPCDSNPRGHRITCVAFSPDSKQVAVAASGAEIKVWQVPDLRSSGRERP
jgi:WD40 repeat protein